MAFFVTFVAEMHSCGLDFPVNGKRQSGYGLNPVQHSVREQNARTEATSQRHASCDGYPAIYFREEFARIILCLSVSLDPPPPSTTLYNEQNAWQRQFFRTVSSAPDTQSVAGLRQDSSLLVCLSLSPDLPPPPYRRLPPPTSRFSLYINYSED